MFYIQKVVSRLVGIPQSTLCELSKQLKVGTPKGTEKHYTDEEIKKIIEYKTRNHNKIIDIIKKKQPITIKALIAESEFSRIKTLKLLTQISGTYEDEPIDTNIWEDYEGKLYYGTKFYKHEFFYY